MANEKIPRQVEIEEVLFIESFPLSTLLIIRMIFELEQLDLVHKIEWRTSKQGRLYISVSYVNNNSLSSVKNNIGITIMFKEIGKIFGKYEQISKTNHDEQKTGN